MMPTMAPVVKKAAGPGGRGVWEVVLVEDGLVNVLLLLCVAGRMVTVLGRAVGTPVPVDKVDES